MARAYSVDLRERVVRALAGGAKFEVSISFVVKLMQRWHQRGTIQPDRIGGWKRSTLAAHGERLRALLAAEPDLTIAELRHLLAQEGIATSRSGVGRFLAAIRRSAAAAIARLVVAGSPLSSACNFAS